MPHHSTCLDCKYFLRHYTKRENGSFVPTAHGALLSPPDQAPSDRESRL